MAGIQALLDIMSRLRDPEGGCPWDLEQEFETISPHTIEEAYEVDEAIARGDLEALRDELGDLLFQVVFQARIAEEQGAFDFEGVTEAITSKLIRRHPHVFAQAETPGTSAAQRASWEEIKAAERAAAGRLGDTEPDPFEGVPRHLPALARSAKLLGRILRLADSSAAASIVAAAQTAPLEAVRGSADEAARFGGDAAGAGAEADRAGALRLVGRGLRAWVGLARALGVDPEQALRQSDDETISAIRRDVHQGGNSPDR